MSRFRLPGQAPVTCSFCGLLRRPSHRLIAGPRDRFICGDCVPLLPAAAAAGSVSTAGVSLVRASRSRSTDASTATECGFCGKPSAAVRWLVVGQAAAICDECSYLCQEILAE